MSYCTYFEGKFNLNKPLDKDTYKLLLAISNQEKDIEKQFDYDPSAEPDDSCEWIPSKDRMSIDWNGQERFYDYVEWIKYLIKKILKPKGYIVNGKVEYEGEDRFDLGVIEIIDNKVKKIPTKYIKVKPTVKKKETVKPTTKKK